MNNVQLELRMSIAHDTKKVFTKSKDNGNWCWYNRGDEEDLSIGFLTFWEALVDATQPYLDDNENT